MTTIIKAHNPPLLFQELSSQFGSVADLTSYAGESVYFNDTQHTTQEIADITAIINAHDENVLTDEQQTEVIEANSGTQAANIPGWATWDEATALAWHDNNVGDVIDAVPANITGLSQAQLVNVIQALVTTVKALDTENRAKARMIIALRNKVFPNLQE